MDSDSRDKASAELYAQLRNNTPLVKVTVKLNNSVKTPQNNVQCHDESSLLRQSPITFRVDDRGRYLIRSHISCKCHGSFYIAATSNNKMTQNLASNANEKERADMITNGLIQDMHIKIMKHDISKSGHDFNPNLICRDISSPTTFSLLSKLIEQGSLLHQLQNKKHKVDGTSTDANLKGISEMTWRNGDEWKSSNRNTLKKKGKEVVTALKMACYNARQKNETPSVKKVYPIIQEIMRDIKKDIPSFELSLMPNEDKKRLDLLEGVISRAKECLDGLRKNFTKENQKIIGSFYSIFAPSKTGMIGKTYKLFGLEKGYSDTIDRSINRRQEWDKSMKNSSNSLSIGDRVFFKYGVGIISENSLGKGENLIFINYLL